MDDNTRSPESQPPQDGATSDNPTSGASPESTGTGWSSPTLPTRSTPSSRDAAATPDPWAIRPHDTGVIPRPTDTQTLGTPQAAGSVPPVGGPVPPTDGYVPPAGASVPQADASSPAGATVPPGGGSSPAGAFTSQSAPSGPAATKSRRSTALVLSLALGAGLLGGAAGSAAYDALTDDDTPAVTSLDDDSTDDSTDTNVSTTALSSVEEVAEQVTPSVVSIGFSGPQGDGGGSGVIISSDGQILTNNHVAQAAANGDLTVTFHDGTTAPAEVIAGDPQSDIAVIQAQDVSGLTPADLGSSADVQVGEQVVAIGSPHGLDGTVTTGIVSALDRPVTAGDPQRGETSTFAGIQTDAPINPGNSGGPLVNMAGQVIGINTAIATSFGSDGSIGLGFSIPIDQARWVADELIDSGTVTYARIGIEVSNATGDVRGAEIRNVTSDSAAADAGLQSGDVITSIDDRIVPNNETLVAMARSYRPGDEVTLTYVRDGEEHTIDVVLGSSAPTT